MFSHTMYLTKLLQLMIEFIDDRSTWMTEFIESKIEWQNNIYKIFQNSSKNLEEYNTLQ